MESLSQYLSHILEEEGGTATPANTIGMGNPDLGELISAPEGGIPHGDTKIIRRKKRRKKKEPDFKMSDDIHNV